jgi:hypothetical protein
MRKRGLFDVLKKRPPSDGLFTCNLPLLRPFDDRGKAVRVVDGDVGEHPAVDCEVQL